MNAIIKYCIGIYTAIAIAYVCSQIGIFELLTALCA